MILNARQQKISRYTTEIGICRANVDVLASLAVCGIGGKEEVGPADGLQCSEGEGKVMWNNAPVSDKYAYLCHDCA